MLIKPILPNEVNSVWSLAKKQLDRAFDNTIADSADHHFEPLMNDLEQLWSINNRSWAITRVIDGRGGRWLEYVAIGGDQIHQWLPKFLNVTGEWGKSYGCNKSVMNTRLGMKKLLPDYKISKVTLLKDL